MPKTEPGPQFRTLMQGAFSKFGLVSREGFDSQMLVPTHTHARLGALETRVAELESKPIPPTD